MKIDENYTLEGEEYNWILLYKKPTGEISEKTGKEIVNKGRWYFPRIEQALQKYVDHVLKPEESVLKVIQKQEEILELIDKLRVKQ